MALLVKRSKIQGSHEWKDHDLVQGNLVIQKTSNQRISLAISSPSSSRYNTPYYKLILSQTEINKIILEAY
ncbi:hypothetical protein LCGC14_2001400 [marine sediment metagenome]|uniref:Uncharacterized protein n=1 Tax=marine sediment metagenome TaxID=412755 RepID=A0A0F9I096_9ZZZZ